MTSFVSKFICGLLCFMSATTVSASADSFKLDIGDKISIQVFQHSDMNKTVTVERDGMVRFPFAGSCYVVGKTVEELQTDLIPNFELLGVKTPVLFVSVANYAPRTVHILGAIAGSNKESASVPKGTVNLPYRRGLHALEAISSVGGFAPTADINRVFIRRETKDGIKVIHVDVKNVLAGSAKKDILLERDDMIIVPFVK